MLFTETGNHWGGTEGMCVGFFRQAGNFAVKLQDIDFICKFATRDGKQ